MTYIAVKCTTYSGSAVVRATLPPTSSTGQPPSRPDRRAVSPPGDHDLRSSVPVEEPESYAVPDKMAQRFAGPPDRPKAFTPQWIAAATEICDTPIAGPECHAKKTVMEAILGSGDGDGDDWPSAMQNILNAYLESVAKRDAVEAWEVVCRANGCLAFLSGDPMRMFQKSVNPVAHWVDELQIDMGQQEWANDFAWPVDYQSKRLSKGPAVFFPIDASVDPGILLIFKGRKHQA